MMSSHFFFLTMVRSILKEKYLNFMAARSSKLPWLDKREICGIGNTAYRKERLKIKIVQA